MQLQTNNGGIYDEQTATEATAEVTESTIQN